MRRLSGRTLDSRTFYRKGGNDNLPDLNRIFVSCVKDSREELYSDSAGIFNKICAACRLGFNFKASLARRKAAAESPA